ncbi:unnamed protein product [Sphagnum tenellum]
MPVEEAPIGTVPSPKAVREGTGVGLETFVREFGMMHLVTGSETYKIASRVVTEALGRIDERMNLEALMQESTTIWKNTCTNDDFDWILDQDRAIMTKEDVASTSDSDTGTDEGSQEILQLILQEQVDEFMDEEITDADDYADWMRWVSDAEQSRRAMYESTHDAAVPLLLQQPSRRYASSIPALLQIVQMKNGNFDCSTIEQLGSSSHEEMDTRWREIYQRIRIDNNLDEGGQQELWKILEHYQDVFDWNKGIPGIKGSAG